MKTRPVLMFILLMIISDAGANLPKLPIMQCPVGTSLDSAFFFGQTLPQPFTDSDHNDAITKVNTRLGQYKGKTQAQLRSMLKATCNIPGSISDAELINRTSVYWAVEKFTSVSGKCDPAGGRQDLEDYVEHNLGYIDDARWFHMFKGYLNPQDVVLMACDAEVHLPKGQFNIKLELIITLIFDFSFSVSSFYDDYTGDGFKCYALDANTDQVQTLTNVPDIGGGPLKNCQMHCRSQGLQSTLESSSDPTACLCTNKALKARKMNGCDGSNELRHFSNGIGFPPVAFNVWPNLGTEGIDYNTEILDSQFVKVSYFKEIKSVWANFNL